MSFDGLTKEEVAIQQLRERIRDVTAENEKFDDVLYLLQWLKRQDFKLDKTEASIRESVAWRREKNIDMLAEREMAFGYPGLAKDFPATFDAKSKTGQPVLTINGDSLDFRALHSKYGKEAGLQYFTQIFAKAEKLMIEYNKAKLKRGQSQRAMSGHVSNGNGTTAVDSSGVTNYPGKITFGSASGLIVIASFKDFSFWNATSTDVIQLLLEVSKMGIKYFPCLASTVYLINTNTFVSVVFKLLKPIIASPAYTVECFDCDKNKWSKALLQDIDASQLTPHFGGCRLQESLTHSSSVGVGVGDDEDVPSKMNQMVTCKE